MNLKEHAANVAVGVGVLAILGILAAYFELTTPRVVRWLHQAMNDLTVNVQLPRWAVGLWAAITLFLIVRGMLSFFLNRQATAREAYRTDIIKEFMWQFQVGSANRVTMDQKVYCRKCGNEYRIWPNNYQLAAADTSGTKELPIICSCCQLSTSTFLPLSTLINEATAEAERRIRIGEWRGAKKRLRKARREQVKDVN